VRTLIVGAGIAGLSTALRLRQLGLPATVVEAAPAPRGGGYMIDFLDPGIAAADRLGLRPGLEDIHTPVARLVFLDAAGATRYAVGYPALRRRAFGGRHYNFFAATSSGCCTTPSSLRGARSSSTAGSSPSRPPSTGTGRSR
jgi:2-polyprenyl-6-methoxyphenol hydroxylase-like FAD-dependent oxidoreductase